jgi:hypothetical protein
VIVDAYREAITTGAPAAIRRAEAAERLLSRVYGRPTEHVATNRAPPASLEALRALSHEQRLELLRGIGEGKVLRLVDAVPEDADVQPARLELGPPELTWQCAAGARPPPGTPDGR